MEAAASPTEAGTVTGQRITLDAKQAAAGSAADPRRAEVVRVSPFPERVVTLRCDGDATPGWNDVVAQARRPRRRGEDS